MYRYADRIGRALFIGLVDLSCKFSEEFKRNGSVYGTRFAVGGLCGRLYVRYRKPRDQIALAAEFDRQICDVIALGIKPSPAMGELLERLLSEVQDEKLENTREALTLRVQHLLRSGVY